MIHPLGKPLRVQHRESVVRATLVAWRPVYHHWDSPGKRWWVTAVQMERNGWTQRYLEDRRGGTWLLIRCVGERAVKDKAQGSSVFPYSWKRSFLIWKFFFASKGNCCHVFYWNILSCHRKHHAWGKEHLPGSQVQVYQKPERDPGQSFPCRECE